MGHGIDGTFPFLAGAAMMGASVVSLHFLKFWKKTRDRLFLFFGLAFGFMALERTVLFWFIDPSIEYRSLVYILRLISFVLILWAIVDKNGSSSAKK